MSDNKIIIATQYFQCLTIKYCYILFWKCLSKISFKMLSSTRNAHEFHDDKGLHSQGWATDLQDQPLRESG